MLRWRIRCYILAVAVWGLPGCEKSPAPATVPGSQQSSAAAPEIPTTQQFLAAPFHEVLLRPLPLKAPVPQSWSIETIPGTEITLLRGPGPAGNPLHIQLSVLMSMTPQRMELMLKAAQREAATDKSFTQCDVRQSGDMQVLETQRLLRAATRPEDQPIEWKITYFIQRDLNYDSYVLSIIGLTQSQYAESKELLRKIVDSVSSAPLAG